MSGAPIITKRQARQGGNTRYDKRSDNGLRNLHRKYAECGADAYGEGVVNTKGNILPKNRSDIAFWYLSFRNRWIKLDCISAVYNKIRSVSSRF